MFQRLIPPLLLAFVPWLLGAATQPNIIYIVSDDHGYRDLGAFGNPYGSTLSPELDQLAAEGVKMDNFYVTAPVCAPSRGGFLTARYNQRFGYESPSLSIGAAMDEGLSQSEILLPRYLKDAGYATACFGKWHIGFAPGSRPLDRGFDEFIGLASGLNDYFNHYNLGNLDMFVGNSPRKADPAGEYTSDFWADAAIDFIDRKQDEPFFIYLPFTAPHWAPSTNPPRETLPAQAPQEYLDLYASESDARQGNYASITAMDAAIGRIVDKLEALNLKDDTIIIFFGDHGGETDGGFGGADNSPLRGDKGSLWEGGIRTVGLVSWPAELPQGTTCSVPIISMDMSRLVIEAAGASTAMANGPIDGLDPTEVLKGNSTTLHDFLAWRYGNQAAIRKGDYKLIGSESGGGIASGAQLYDLSNDPDEGTDLSGSMPAKVAELENDFNAVWRPAISNDTAL